MSISCDLPRTGGGPLGACTSCADYTIHFSRPNSKVFLVPTARTKLVAILVAKLVAKLVTTLVAKLVANVVFNHG